MEVATLLEYIANHTHHQLVIDDILVSQSKEIQTAFRENNAALLKKQFANSGNLADRNEVIQIIE